RTSCWRRCATSSAVMRSRASPMSVGDADGDVDGAGTRWIAVADAAALRREAFRRVVDAADRAIRQRGCFLIVLAGGNTPRGAYRMLRGADTGWSHWQVYFGDERCLPVGDAERNSRAAADTWLDHVAIPEN